MLCMFMSCLLTRTCIDCISVMSDAGRSLSVFCVVLVKGMSWWISVSRPPPPDLARSFRIWEYPGNFGAVDLGRSLVSWITAMWMFWLRRSSFISLVLF